MKNIIVALALCAMPFVNARASITLEVELADSNVETIFTAETVGESDIAGFLLEVVIYAVDGDAYIPTIGELAINLDWRTADPFIANQTIQIVSTADDFDGFFLVAEGDQEYFAVSVFASANQDTMASLQLVGLNWTGYIDGDLVTLTEFDQEIETDFIFINTEIVPEPGTVSMMMIGLLSAITMRRRSSYEI